MDDKIKVTPKVRLREQLKLFMGATTSRYQAISYVVAEKLVRDVLFLKFPIGRQKGQSLADLQGVEV